MWLIGEITPAEGPHDIESPMADYMGIRYWAYLASAIDSRPPANVQHDDSRADARLLVPALFDISETDVRARAIGCLCHADNLFYQKNTIRHTRTNCCTTRLSCTRSLTNEGIGRSSERRRWGYRSRKD